MDSPTTPQHEKKKKFDLVFNYDVSLSEELKRAFSLDKQTKPELIVGKSEILDIVDVENIVQHVLTADCCSWSLAYSASIHDRTLKGFYRRLSYLSASDTPIVILIKDKEKHVHGVFLPKFNSDEVKEKESTPTFFHIRPKFHIFQGIGKQEWSIHKTNELLCIVDLSVKSGLWINGDLSHGKLEEYISNSIEGPETNPIKVHHFSIKTLECWMLTDIQSKTNSN